MKISLNWLCDHIVSGADSIDVNELTARFNERTAEIEAVVRVHTELDDKAIVKIIAIEGERIIANIPEMGREYALKKRSDARVGDCFLVNIRGDACDWTLLSDLASTKEGLVPALLIDDDELRVWKERFELVDHIFTIDNKSITHRPDLWGHRGIAREVAAFFNLNLEPFDTLSVPLQVNEFERLSQGAARSSFEIHREVSISECERFAGIHVPNVQAKPSLLWMVSRLCRVDTRPIDALVDGTNYAMLDVGHPMHVFDAQKLSNKPIVVRFARSGEVLETLDDEKLELSQDDLVVAFGDLPVSLAGVMGGKESGASRETSAVFLEAACFDAATIRKTALRHKKRSEASARFEKGLDQENVQYVLARYLKLMIDARVIEPKDSFVCTSVGVAREKTVIEVLHTFIERRIGTQLERSVVVDNLKRLGFDVEVQGESGGDIVYHVHVPSFRAIGDIEIPEDVVEEVVRCVGYSSIETKLPSLTLSVSDTGSVDAVRDIKRLLAYGCQMQELYTYSFYHEDFLKEFGHDPKDAVEIANPVSENQYRLSTSLVPHLIRVVAQNSQDHEQLRFFEWARVWHDSSSIDEQSRLAGILFHKREPVDFYHGKQVVERIAKLRGLSLEWKNVGQLPYEWCAQGETADVCFEGASIGYAGCVDLMMLSRVTEGHAFVFEIDGDALIRHRKDRHRFEPISKYPEVVRDVSMLVPFSCSVAQLEREIKTVDNRIADVRLMDMFQKKEWSDYRAVTIRFVLRDMVNTMTKQDVDGVQEQVYKVLAALGVTIR